VNSLLRLALLLCLLPFGACTTLGGAIDGVVVDTSTGKPLPGAFVIAQWTRKGSDGYGSRSSCPHLEVVQADAQGRYRIPEVPVDVTLGSERWVFGYLQGYANDLPASDDEKRVAMKAFKGTGGERRESFRTYSSLRDCSRWNDFEGSMALIRKLRPLFNALDEESKVLRLTNTERNQPGRFARSLQELEESLSIDMESRERNGARMPSSKPINLQHE
jgi:hypothetical protein